MPRTVLKVLLAFVAAAALVAGVDVVLISQDSPRRATAYVVLEPQLTLAAKAARRATVAKPARRTKAPKPNVRERQPTAATLLPNDPLWQSSWSLAKVGAPAAWSVTTGSPETIVAVLDTGIDPTHPDLQGAVVPGWDFVNGDADPSDDHGHGTAVAGVIAARSNNGIGVTGACWRCSVMPVKVIAANGIGNSADIAEGLRWAADHGAAVINMSFVMSGPDGAVASAIDYARAKGAIVVAAAGNSAAGAVTFPAGHPGTISVTATDSADALYTWATFGSWVSVATPGCTQTTFLGGGYGEFCGTSSAAAFMSGMTALVRSAESTVGPDVIFSLLATNAVRVGDFVSSGRIAVDAVFASLRGPSVAASPSGQNGSRQAKRPLSD